MEKITPVKIVPGQVEGFYRVFWGEGAWGFSVSDFCIDEMAAYMWAMSPEGQRFGRNWLSIKRKEVRYAK